MPGLHTNADFKDYKKYGLLKYKSGYLFKGSNGNFLVYDYDSPNPNDWKFPYKIRKASESGHYCVKFDNLSLVKDIVDFMEGKSKELPKGAMKVFLKKKLGGPRPRVFAYKGEAITANTKEEAIQQIVAAARKPKKKKRILTAREKKLAQMTPEEKQAFREKEKQAKKDRHEKEKKKEAKRKEYRKFVEKYLKSVLDKKLFNVEVSRSTDWSGHFHISAYIKANNEIVSKVCESDTVAHLKFAPRDKHPKLKKSAIFADYFNPSNKTAVQFEKLIPQDIIKKWTKLKIALEKLNAEWKAFSKDKVALIDTIKKLGMDFHNMDSVERIIKLEANKDNPLLAKMDAEMKKIGFTRDADEYFNSKQHKRIDIEVKQDYLLLKFGREYYKVKNEMKVPKVIEEIKEDLKEAN